MASARTAFSLAGLVILGAARLAQELVDPAFLVQNGELLESGHFQIISKVRQNLYVRLRTFTLENCDPLLVILVVVLVTAFWWEVKH